MSYRASNGIWQEIVSDQEALKVWDATPAHLRGGNPESGFLTWAADEFGRRIECASITYIPMSAEEHLAQGGPRPAIP